MTTYERYEVLVSGLGFPESLRWRDGALWYADWAAGTVVRVGADRQPQVVARRASFPLCFDLLTTADGLRPLLVSTPDQAVLLASDGRRRADPVRRSGRPRRRTPGTRSCSPPTARRTSTTSASTTGAARTRRRPGRSASSSWSGRTARSSGSPTGWSSPTAWRVVDDGRTLLVAESWGSRLTAYAISRRRAADRSPGLGRDPGPAPRRHRRPRSRRRGRQRLAGRRRHPLLRPGRRGRRDPGPGRPAPVGLRLRGRRPGCPVRRSTSRSTTSAAIRPPDRPARSSPSPSVDRHSLLALRARGIDRPFSLATKSVSLARRSRSIRALHCAAARDGLAALDRLPVIVARTRLSPRRPGRSARRTRTPSPATPCSGR